MAPSHESHACVLHVGGDRAHAALTPDAAAVPAPVFCVGSAAPLIAHTPDCDARFSVQARGPPSY